MKLHPGSTSVNVGGGASAVDARTPATSIPGTKLKFQSCIEATQEWCKSRRLQLNPAKTELIWFGSKANLKKIADLDLNLYIGADVIKPVSVVRDLGVFLDSELSMRHHINTVVRSCFFHLLRLRSVRRILGADVTAGLVSAFVTTRLDYCNSILAGLPRSSSATQFMQQFQKLLHRQVDPDSERHFVKAD